MLLKKIIIILILLMSFVGYSQEKKEQLRATLISESTLMKPVGPLIGKKLIPETLRTGEINPKQKDANRVVPGKGLPKGKDALLNKQENAQNLRTSKTPSLVFEASSTFRAPSDPTGAVGPNHYVSARNSAFTIHDKNGTVLVQSTSLANIFPRETLGDPIVFYDSFADRFVITQFSDSPNGFLVAVCQGSDPVNDGWFTYRFNTGSFPDYTKFSIWSDGYYVTANKDQGTQQTSEVVFVIEREKMLAGASNAQMVGFPLPGARIGGFYSPAGFNAMGNTPPPPGDARIIYFQDDSWQGVTEDALKLWTININWASPSLSTITEAEELTVSGGDITAFDSVFDGTSFSNLPQPEEGSLDIDVLQGTVMYATNYRRFCDYNSVLLNFAIDIDDRPNSDNISAIRWYELRQNGDGQPWTVFQEGTHASPNGKSAWCASLAMDIFGNIGMAYTTMGTVANLANEDSFPSIRYTGRLADDPSGTMTFSEQDIIIGTDIQRNGGERYGDYAQITVDPIDDSTFWHIAEYFENTGDNARNIVGVFKIASDVTNDVGVVSIDSPTDATLTNAEVISVTIKNFGTTTQTNIPISYSINGSTPIEEIFTGSLAGGQTTSFSFNTTTNLSSGTSFIIDAETNLSNDTMPQNDCASSNVKNLLPNDVGVSALISPVSGGGFSATQSVTILIQNFGGVEQSDIPVYYILDSGQQINEVFTGTINSGESAQYTFSQTVDLSEFNTYVFQLGTNLDNDQDNTNDSITQEIIHELCSPISNCSQFGDGLTSFTLSNISNTIISCNTGYEDFTDLIINLDKSLGIYSLDVRTGFARNDEEKMSIWIDFNDNSVFEATELILSNAILSNANIDLNFTIVLGPNTIPGRHTMRVRAGDTSNNNGAPLNDPCGAMDFGTTHDYTVDIGENTSPITDVVIIGKDDDLFDIVMSDSNAPNELRLYVFSITGQLIVSKMVLKNPNGTFIYPNLDMSYASTGIYFVRFGGNENNRSKSFIVK
ncbi:T9SS type A sorting domain-containing protein [Aquimarina sp. MMG016]|uniref:T9SS type A sorting domain-containing protein n=1 Tax=Aquimarina sp. MMG016 TaxID=2822690 RepID=UPI001B39D886|nr:T9SS type A sorting domain-containing protein [Aquimarina sp. MMG016]MBQ4819972.1 T9SS type A sorting domain-containing protein [Aquimarina sp. MMG016]